MYASMVLSFINLVIKVVTEDVCVPVVGGIAGGLEMMVGMVVMVPAVVGGKM